MFVCSGLFGGKWPRRRLRPLTLFVKKMGKMGLMKGGDEHMAKQMARNPKMVQQQLHKAMDPRMLAQMGGAGNMMNMMKEMSKLDMEGAKGMLGGLGL